MNLTDIFSIRQSFMQEIEEKIPGTYPEHPDLSDPKTQSVVREITLRGVEEIFEALQHLKGWKNHRNDIDCNVDEEEFLEEIVDAFNYFFSLRIKYTLCCKIAFTISVKLLRFLNKDPLSNIIVCHYNHSSKPVTSMVNDPDDAT